MTQNIGRRTVAGGLAWAVPAVVTTTAAPAFAISGTAPTDECKDNIPVGAGPYWPADGNHSYSSTGGDAGTAVTTAFNYGMNDRSVSGSTTFKFYDGASQTYVAQPYVTLNNGLTYCGTVTLGGTGSFVAPSGVNSSTSVRWHGTSGLIDDSLWKGVTAHLPFIYYWTSNGTVYSAQYELLITYPGGTNDFSGAVQNATVRIVKASYGCAPRGCSSAAPVLTDATPDYPKAGSIVTLTGSRFTGATAVTYNGNKLAYTVVSDTEIAVTMPTTWPSGMAWGTVYYFVVCNTVGCSNSVGVARGS